MQSDAHARRLHHLIRQIPDELLPQFNLGGAADTAIPQLPGIDPDLTRQVIAFKHVDFGWKFCLLVARHRLEFPVIYNQNDSILFRAWVYLLDPEGSEDFEMRTALTFMTPARQHDRATLKAALIAPDATIERTAAMLQTDPVAIRIFEKLFFNILDRKKDLLYLQSILFPAGRGVELNQGYLRTEQTENIMLRAAWQNGVQDALFWSGGSNSALQTIAATSSASELENTLLGYGMLVARNGGLNQSGRDLPSLSAARQIVTAAKMGGAAADDSLVPLDLGAAIKAEIQAHRVPIRSPQMLAKRSSCDP